MSQPGQKGDLGLPGLPGLPVSFYTAFLADDSYLLHISMLNSILLCTKQ